jgi:uncharacterized protein YndB with AHSA1/START domain
VTTEAPFDWSQFQLGIYINAQPEALYNLWTTPVGLTRWFLRSAAFAPTDGPPPRNTRRKIVIPPFDDLAPRPDDQRCEVNDRYLWEWHYNGGIAGEEWVLAMRPPTKLTFGFGSRMEVEVLLRKQGRTCEVGLRQYNIPTNGRAKQNLHMGCRTAWTFFLTNLKSVAEGGADLRETVRAKTMQLHLVNI